MYTYIKETYKKLKKKYLENFQTKESRLSCNPIKQAFVLKAEDNVAITTTNVMCAKTDNGIITKMITIDDETGKTLEQIAYVSNRMRNVNLKNDNITTLRCGYMACLSMDLNIKIKKTFKVGFIGNGKINQTTCNLLSAIFGIHRFVICGSPQNRGKNIDKFKLYGEVKVDNGDCTLLNTCDVVFCCTNSYKKENLISNYKLCNVKLIVAQDSGYLLDESFRENRVCYTDHLEQLEAHYEDEFPFDNKRYVMYNLIEDYSDNYKCVYLYGIAFADAILVERKYFV